MKRTTTLLLALAATATAFAEVKVTPGDIADNRGKGKFSRPGLSVELKIAGPELADCKGLRVVLKAARDDAGKAIAEQPGFMNDGGFQSLQSAFGNFDNNKKDEFQAQIDLENPARSAKSLTLDASVELLVPAKDPTAVITVDLAKEAGKALAAKPLAAAGVSLTFKAPSGSELSYSINDSKKKIGAIEFCSADGKPLETSGRMTSGFGENKDVSISLRGSAPAGAIAKVYLLTDKSVVTVPIKLNNVALP